MGGKARGAWAAVLFSALSITAAAVAAPPPNADAAAEAARLDASATKLAKAGAVREALAALRRSEELVPKRATLERIAALQRQDKDFAGAYSTYAEMLRRFDAELKPKDKTDIHHSMDELAAITGGVHLKVVEPGAKVEVDGAPVGDAPLETTVRVNLGVHTVKVSKPHFDTFEWRGEVASGAETQVVAELKPSPGTLSVHVKGAPTIVRIDGNEVGPTPWRGPVPPGKHVVETGDPPSGKKEVEIVGGEEADVEMQGETRGRLAISVTPSNAEIVVDGAPRGAGAWDGPVEAGPHQIEVVAEGYETARLTVLSAPGVAKSERIQLAPLPPRPRFDGVYGIIATDFMGAPTAHNFITDACALKSENCSGGHAAIGGEIPIRIGYSFGYLGVEGVSLVRYDQVNMTEQVSGPPPFMVETVSYMVYRITVADGVAVRFMPKTQGARLSTALGLAWSHQIIGVSAGVKGGKSFPRPSADGDAPMLLFDVGVLFGNTPGARFRLALEGSVEFLGDGFVDPSKPSLPLAQGTVVFLGPSLGLQIGH